MSSSGVAEARPRNQVPTTVHQYLAFIKKHPFKYGKAALRSLEVYAGSLTDNEIANVRLEHGDYNFLGSVEIIDSIDGTLEKQWHHATRVPHLDGSFRQALESRPADSKTRIILAQQKKPSFHPIDFFCLATLGTYYELDPRFLCAYIERFGWKPGQVGPMLSVDTPSKRRFLEVYLLPRCWMALQVCQEEGRNTIIALAAGDPSTEVNLDDMFYRMNADDIIEADENPLLYFFPYFESLLQEHMAFQRTRSYLNAPNAQAIIDIWKSMWNEMLDLKRTKQSFERFFSAYGNDSIMAPASTERLSSFIADCELQLADTEQLMDQLRAEVQVQQSKMAIREAQKSLEQADSVRKLTIVASIFIPLNFATSFFGMNLQQLDTGSINIGWFILVAFLSSAFCYGITRSIRPIENIILRFEKQWQSTREKKWTLQDGTLKYESPSPTKRELATFVAQQTIRSVYRLLSPWRWRWLARSPSGQAENP